MGHLKEPEELEFHKGTQHQDAWSHSLGEGSGVLCVGGWGGGSSVFDNTVCTYVLVV